jgi:four helix bundle protein
MKESIIKTKSFLFSLNIIKLYKQLTEEKEFIISKQLLRSGTSIGANIEEALAGQSKRILRQKCQFLQKRQEKQNIDCDY